MPELGEVKRSDKIGYAGLARCIWLACTECGKERWVRIRHGQPTEKLCLLCGIKHRMENYQRENHGMWKGGIRNSKDGYIEIRLSRDDFFYPMANSVGYVLEHRLLIARHLGRCLLPWEIVHHKNGDKKDNRLENLELLPSKKYHIVDSYTKSLIKQLEGKIDRLLEKQDKLLTEIRLLRLANKELRERC